MILGRMVLRLEAEGSASLPTFHGRLLHGALFALISDSAPRLAAYIHDELTIKPFTVSNLVPEKGARPRIVRGRNSKGRQAKSDNNLAILAGEFYSWPISVLNESVAQALLALEIGTPIKVGKASFILREIVTGGAGLGLVAADDMIAAVLGVERIESIAFEFTSPVAFRVGTSDYPLPLPTLVFGSLADKWCALAMPARIERSEIAALAERVELLSWYGSSERVYFAADRGVLAARGRFTYGLDGLTLEERQILLLLAQLARFTGVGRLTAQGFGEVSVRWK